MRQLPSLRLVESTNSAEGSALRSLLDQSVIYEKAGGVMPMGLVLFGFYGAGLLVASGLLAFILPSPHAIGHGGFFLLLRGEAAGLDSVMRTIALPGVLCGLALIGLDVFLSYVRTSNAWRSAIIGQTLIGAASGALAIIFIASVILNLVIWLLIIAAFVFAIGAMLAGLASG